MENFLNRRMFQSPIRAADGVYVPTLEDILQFYQGELDANGQPINQEALAQAAELATIVGAEQGSNNSQLLDDIVSTNDANDAGRLPSQAEIDASGIFGNQSNIATEDESINLNNISTEGVKIGDDLTVFNADNLPVDLQNKTDAMNKSEADALRMQEQTNNLNNQRLLELNSATNPATEARDLVTEEAYAQRQLDIANQKELFESLQGTKVKNLAGDMEQDLSGDEIVENIKRNILSGTNIVEQNKNDPVYSSLSSVNKMKVDDAISNKKQEDLDLTYGGEQGMQNFIDAAGGSAETAIMIWNDMVNASGRVSEGANELLEGWKKAFSKGFSDEQKETLDSQLEYLKSKEQTSVSEIMGVPLEDLESGSGKVKEFYEGSIFPNMIEGGLDIFKNIWGAGDMGDGELPPELQPKPLTTEEEYLKASGIATKGDADLSADLSFKTKVNEGKNRVIETVDEIKETVIEKFPEIKDKVTEKIEVLKEKLKNGDITKESFFEKINEIKDITIDKVTDLDVKEKVTDLFEDVKKSTTDFFTKKEVPIESDTITSGTSESGDKKIDVAGRADLETPIKEEEVAEIDQTITDGNEVVTSNNEGAGNVAVNESIGTGSSGTGSGAFTTTTGSGTSSGDLNIQDMITETAKQTGYNFKGMDDSKDDLALKTMMYGLKLFMTPGKFSDAVAAVGTEALTNEINQRYKTKAATAKFKGDMFKTILAGKLDIAKEIAKLKGKKTDYKTYSYEDKMLNASVGSWIRNNLGIDVQLEFDGLPPKNDPEAGAAYVFATKFKQEIQKIGNNRKTEGTEDPSIDDELLIEAYNNISGDFKASKAELSIIDKTFNWVTGKSDQEIEAQRVEKGSLETSDQYKRKLVGGKNNKVITEVMINNAIEKNSNLSLTREDVIKALQNDPTFKDWDYSKVV
tara:strand:- start:2305 stop:5055 length:2751 start_codon:yes stop_codon:yes gene_type:complete